jgi:hypothetical protein
MRSRGNVGVVAGGLHLLGQLLMGCDVYTSAYVIIDRMEWQYILQLVRGVNSVIFTPHTSVAEASELRTAKLYLSPGLPTCRGEAC